MGLTQITTGGVDDNINIDSGTLKVDGTNNRVGIGTTSPGTILNIRSDSSDDGILLEKTDGTDIARLFHDATTTDARLDMFSGGSANIQLKANGVSHFSGGNVGIGTTSPSAPLDVVGNDGIAIQSSAQTNEFLIRPSSSSADGIRFTQAGGGGDRMVIDSSGNVGIGTTSPNALLDVNGQARFGGNKVTLDTDGSIGGTISNSTTRAFVLSNTDVNADYFGGRVIQIGPDGTVNIGGSAGTSPSSYSSPNIKLNPAGSSFINGGNVGIGISSPSSMLHLNGGSPSIRLSDTGANGSAFSIIEDNNGLLKLRNDAGNSGTGSGIAFDVDGSERMRIGSDGVVSINQTSASNIFRIQSSSAGEANALFQNSTTGLSPGNGLYVGVAGSIGYMWNYENSALSFATNNSERGRFTNDGHLLVAKSTTAFENAGHLLGATGSVDHTRNNAPIMYLNRTSSDGGLVNFYQASNLEGSISVSGNTVSYNGGHLARWSQLAAGAERTEILRGSVLSNLDEMCEWGEEDNEQLNRMKVSDVEGDVNVAGVFQAWDDDDDTYTNDFYCAMTGDFVIRIAQGTTVARGDLLMSAGDGTAKPQDDDIVRSKTIAKVTSTTVSTTYSDGSYCVPCVLMAC